ncbi:hypothetical protein CSX04_00708 [Burkholderia cepacia]|nr:hypothetical protein CSX04_00708 [Burkholderia cepacia]
MPRAHRGPGAASPGSFARTPWPIDAAPSSPSPYLERNRHDDGCARTARIAACFAARRAASCDAADSGCVRCRPCGTFDAHSRSSAFRSDASAHVRPCKIPAAVRLAAAGVRASVGSSSSCRTAARRRRAAPSGGTRRLTSRLPFRLPFARRLAFVRRDARLAAARANGMFRSVRQVDSHGFVQTRARRAWCDVALRAAVEQRRDLR